MSFDGKTLHLKPEIDKNFCMSGSVRQHQDKDNFFIDLRWKGERLRVFSGLDGNPLYSRRQADRLLERIRSEIENDSFNPKNYIKRELKALRLDEYATAWLRRQEHRLKAGEISHGYMREFEAQGLLTRGTAYQTGHFSKAIKLEWPFKSSSEPVLYDGRSIETFEQTAKTIFKPGEMRGLIESAGLKVSWSYELVRRIWESSE